MPIIRLCNLLLLILMTSGCATAPSQPKTPISRAPQLISQNLINVLFQINSLHPQSVTLLLPAVEEPPEPFAEALSLALQQAGYALRTTGGDANTVAVSYSMKRSVGGSDGVVNTYILNMGSVSVRRAYRPTDDGWVIPVSSMQIRGADISRVVLNDDIFLRAAERVVAAEIVVDTLKKLAPSEATLPQIVLAKPVLQPGPRPQLQQPLLQQQPLPQAISTEPNRASSEQDQLSDRVAAIQNAPKQNLRNTGVSNFAEILNPMSTVNETVLVFGDDSLRLGSANKERVNQFVSQYHPENDVFSVTGCSHGPSARAGGQKALALGRADRVKQALMFAGVPENKILDEACWANEQFDKRMPRRGVVLSIKRSG